jgi:ribose transport system permease protein
MLNLIGKSVTIFSKFRSATIILLILAFAVVMIFLSPFFLTWDNLRTTIIGLCCDGIIAIGMTIVLISGSIDLSVGAVLGMAGAITGSLYIHGINIYAACLVALAAGLVIGLINGLIISRTSISPMICTLGTMYMARGIALIVTQGSPQSIKNVPESFRFLGKGTILGIPAIIIIFLVIAIVFAFLMNKSVAMRKIFYVGSNEQSAEYSGINVFKVRIGVFLLSAALSVSAGILTTSRFTVATPTAGEGSEMTAISVAVIGGSSISGGEGTIMGTVFGLILITLINNGLILLNVSVYWQKFISGGILLSAVLIDYFSHKNKS